VRNGFRRFPSPAVHAAFAALAQTDSITVDPHKLGYIPYGAGAFVCRDHRPMALLAEEADYVFAGADSERYMARYRRLGRYILEGSKAGAAAAAVYVTHRVLPLDHANFGRLSRQSIIAADAFHRRALAFAEAMRGQFNVCVPFEPDSNLVCLALNPADNHDASAMNAFVHGLHDSLRCDPSQPLQTREFFGSMTTLRPAELGQAAGSRLLQALGIDPATLDPDDSAHDRIVILRHTLMNPYLLDDENGISYIDLYFDYLGRQLHSARQRGLDAARAA
jgi:hypothetical protein